MTKCCKCNHPHCFWCWLLEVGFDDWFFMALMGYLLWNADSKTDYTMNWAYVGGLILCLPILVFLARVAEGLARRYLNLTVGAAEGPASKVRH